MSVTTEGIVLGQRENFLTVVEISTKSRLLVMCDCGSVCRINVRIFLVGQKKSCGCRKNYGNRKIHGHTIDSYSPTYNSWRGMINRCFRPTNNRYDRYGGRGITVCAQWWRFENFLLDMGERPEGHSIDRIDNDGNYEPGNCKWSTPTEQALNRSHP